MLQKKCWNRKNLFVLNHGKESKPYLYVCPFLHLRWLLLTMNKGNYFIKVVFPSPILFENFIILIIEDFLQVSCLSELFEKSQIRHQISDHRTILGSIFLTWNTFCSASIIPCNTRKKLIHSQLNSEFWFNTVLITLIRFFASRSSHPEVFFKKGVLRNFTKFTGKQEHLFD